MLVRQYWRYRRIKMFVFALHEGNAVEYVLADGQTVFDAVENFLNVNPFVTEYYKVRVNPDPQPLYRPFGGQCMNQENFECRFKEWASVEDIELKIARTSDLFDSFIIESEERNE